MDKKTFFIIVCLAVLPITTQAATIHLMKDELVLSSTVWWPEPDTPVYQEVYIGSVFGDDMVPTNPRVQVDGEIPCSFDSSGYADGQWARALVGASDHSVWGEHHTGYGQVCDEHDGWGEAMIDLDWTFKVNGDGAGLRLWTLGWATTTSLSLFDETTQTLIGSVTRPAGSGENEYRFDLMDSHRYRLAFDYGIRSSGDPDPNGNFSLNFGATIVPEPETLALLGLGLLGLCLAKTSKT